MRIHWIWLAHRPQVSDRIKAQLLQRFRDAEDVYFASGDAYRETEGMTPEAKASLEDKNLEEAEEILEVCRQKGIQILTIQDAAYPVRLKNIIDPPLVLYYKGSLPELDDRPVIGVVGTRKASAYGLNTAFRMGYQIAGCGGIVVSGMAGGIDAMAMQGALQAGKTTVGVLGCGVDLVYPRSNWKLFEDVEAYGCILSEYAPGTKAGKWTFPRRNRIISGLSNGVLVVEAPERSGALITAGLALEQGRDVFVVPGNIDQESFVGSNRLLRDGAGAVSGGWDILEEYETLYPGKLSRNPASAALDRDAEAAAKTIPQEEKTEQKTGQKPVLSGKKPNLKENLNKKPIDKEASGSYSDVNERLSRLSEKEKRIVSLLMDGQRLVDDVISESGLNSAQVLAILTMLELKRVVRRLPGKRITLAWQESDL